MSAQLYPLKPGEVREARLELKRRVCGRRLPRLKFYTWLGCHFRIENWDSTQKRSLSRTAW